MKVEGERDPPRGKQRGQRTEKKKTGCSVAKQPGKNIRESSMRKEGMVRVIEEEREEK